MQPIHRSILVFAIFSLVVSSPSSAVDLEKLPQLNAVAVDTIDVDIVGVRGLTLVDGQVWLLVSEREGLGVPEIEYTAALVRFDLASGSVDTVAIETDAYESGLAFDGEKLWAGGNRVGGSELLYRIRIEGAQVDSTLAATGYHPGGLTWGDEYLWQVDCDARQISRLETEEGKISKRIATPGFYPTGVAHTGTRLLCADAATGNVYSIRPRSGQVDAVIDPEVFHRPGVHVSLAWDGQYLWAIAASDSRLIRYDVRR